MAKAKKKKPMAKPKPDPSKPRGSRGPADSYDPAWVKLIPGFAAEGMSIAEIAFELGVGRKSLYRYREKYPELNEAFEEASFIAQAWWERKGRESVGGTLPMSNPSTYQFIMRHRFKEDYPDKQKHELGAAEDLRELWKMLGANNAAPRQEASPCA